MFFPFFFRPVGVCHVLLVAVVDGWIDGFWLLVVRVSLFCWWWWVASLRWWRLCLLRILPPLGGHGGFLLLLAEVVGSLSCCRCCSCDRSSHLSPYVDSSPCPSSFPRFSLFLLVSVAGCWWRCRWWLPSVLVGDGGLLLLLVVVVGFLLLLTVVGCLPLLFVPATVLLCLHGGGTNEKNKVKY